MLARISVTTAADAAVELVIDHSALYELEMSHDLVPETVFEAVTKASGVRAVIGVALRRGADGAADTPTVEEVLDPMSHQEAVTLASRLLYLAIFGREPETAPDTSAEGEGGSPASSSAG